MRSLNEKLDEERLRAEREEEYAREKEITKELERIKLAEETNRLRQENESREKIDAEEAKRKERDEIEKKETAEREAKIKRDEDEKRQAEEELQQEEERKRLEEVVSPTLSKERFKDMWSTMTPAGSFQCKLKVSPNKDVLTAHLTKQGFHVVFSSAPAVGECEVGICNIREDGKGPWFVARFVAGKASFSAVMKCEDQQIVSNFVKKFALAKVLKIDTSS